jgi:cell division transport system permease protein
MSKLAYFFRETLISLRRNVMMTLAGVLTIAVSLSLLGGMLLLGRLVDHGTARIRRGFGAEIFLNVGKVPQSQIDAIGAGLKELQGTEVSSYSFCDVNCAFKAAHEVLKNQPSTLEGMPVGTFPASWRVKLTDGKYADTIASRFNGRAGVKSVWTPAKAAHSIQRVTSFLELMFGVMVAVLFVSSLFLVVNTIRLATYARRREIEVMKLVGASNWFVRVPFMAEGMVQGLAGSGFAFGLVILLRRVLSNAINKAQADRLIKDFYITTHDALVIGSWVLVLGIGLGLAGSLLGLRRFLDV